ncbi:PITH domain-containing protein CG6153 [Tribolium castaneum]|uniref:PITH domain-containing protein CG6153-like Protein n=1 Tax=Tribolium castaneum TaxID=7070 RepID=D6WMZ6_TRICA|nr:PREDICTED: PITH domain-containing protein CG6153 [Tribolium castaneum]EFA03260.1 PITH domain-containing protein CG6153-like Protein [Tribolium castaneum]|eukprot:XP_969551.1 PREDICTED: PITH domain-containing protein CG6153 [Tribolium castaneum]
MAPHGRCCEGDHQHRDTPEMGVEYSLYTKIDKNNLECLNEATEGTGKTVFKPWEERLNFDVYVESDADEELLFNIPFTGNVKLKGIIIIGEDADTHPNKVRMFKNRPRMTFDDVSAVADQEFQLHVDNTGLLEYATKVVTFNSVHHLTLHFPSNFGADTTRIYYIGLRGEYSEAHHHGVTICTYESRPNIADHEKLQDNVTHRVQ